VALALALALAVAVAVAAALVVISTAAASSRVLSHVDGIGHDGAQAFASGWACEQGQAGSVAVRLYADGLADGTPTGAAVATGMADLDNEASVGQACQDKAGKHRFKIALPAAMVSQGRQPKLSAQASAAPPPVPKLSGGYTSSRAHPRVFITQGELRSLARRIAVADSYSARRFALLAQRIARDLAAQTDWQATYSGCNAGVYQYAFSYEPQDGHATEVHAALQLAPSATAPAGAAVIASRLALYAALIKAGAPAPSGAPSAEQAAALATRIELAWAQRGFRDAHGDFLTMPAQFCDGSGKAASGAGSEGLTIGRGIIYSAHAQDLLMYLGVLDDRAVAELDRFHAAMFELMRNSQNYASTILGAATSTAIKPPIAARRSWRWLGCSMIGENSRRRFSEETRRFPWRCRGSHSSMARSTARRIRRTPATSTAVPMAQPAAHSFRRQRLRLARSTTAIAITGRDRGSAIRCSPSSVSSTPPRFCGSPASTRMPIAAAANNRSKQRSHTTPV
jgi:hypothetical protein